MEFHSVNLPVSPNPFQKPFQTRKDINMCTEDASIGIIGGADGPTAIVVAYSGNGWIHLLLFIAILALIVTTTVLIIRHIRKRKK